MIVGNTLCASSPATAFPMLLAGRGLQGIGCAGLMIVTKVILADKVSLKENAKNNTIFTLVGGLGYGVGPSLGGYLTQVSWRWCFILNIPIGIIGVFLAHFVLRPELLGPQEITRTDGDIHAPAVPSTLSAKLSTIDYGGQILFLFGMGMLVLALTWAGDYYSWSDVKVIAPLAIGSCLLVVFLTWEYFLLPGSVVAARYPYLKGMIPLKLLLTRNAGLLIYINFTTGMGKSSQPPLHPSGAVLTLFLILISNVCSLLCRRSVLCTCSELHPW
jgi:MFS family permease